MPQAKYAKEAIDQSRTLFVREAAREHKTNDFACGVLTTLLTNAMVDMPRNKQKEILQVLNTLIVRQIALQ
jgi:hypothetical protein